MPSIITKILCRFFSSSPKHKIYFDLVPYHQHYLNVRNVVSSDVWDKLKRHHAKRCGYRCEVCSASGKQQGYGWEVELHEIWRFNEKTYTQHLDGLISLCPFCHMVKHAALAKRNGLEGAVRRHYQKVNNTNDYDVEFSKAIDECKRRTAHYKLDLSYLNSLRSVTGLQKNFTGDCRELCRVVEA